MSDPTTATTAATAAPTPAAPTPPAETAQSSQAAFEQLRQRAVDLHAAADRAGANRYAQRGAALDDVTREAASARQEAATAGQQAAREREAAREHIRFADDIAEAGRRPGADARFAQQIAERDRAHARAAEERAERLERIAAERGTQADDLDQRVAELQQAVGDESVASAIRDAAMATDSAADQLGEKARLLTMAESMEKDAADYEAQGDTLSAELHRGQAEAVRAEATAIQPEIPEIDQRILDAADRVWLPDPEPGAGQTPVPPTVPPAGPPEPLDPYARLDTDGDGLGDSFEYQLGTSPKNADTDGDKRPDGLEVAVTAYNPRVKEPVDVDPEAAADKEAGIREWEASLGVAHNEDTDGNGVAEWIERSAGISKVENLTADDIKNNLSPIDDFVETAKSQVGKPYRFGAKADTESNESYDGAPAFDSSELVEWAAKHAGVRDMPDGSWVQYRWLHEQGASLPVEEALRTKGALVFGFSSDPLASPDRPARAYVAISLGDGTVLDVSERAGQVRVMQPGNFFTHAATIPELHAPVGDIDDDGWTAQQEIEIGGDPTRGITLPQFEFADPNAVDPADTGTTPDPADPATDPADPLGADRYQGDPATAPAGATAADDPYDAGGGAAPTSPASPAPGAVDSYADTGPGPYGPAPADAYADTAPEPAPSYDDSDAGDAYADPSGDVTAEV